MIDPDSDRARYLQLADALRARIASGELPPGSRLPSEKTLEQETGLNRSTIRRSIEVLRAEGLIVVRHPHGTFVREQGEVEVVEVASGTVTARMPTPEERRQLVIGEGVPVLLVDERIYAADRVALRVHQQSPTN
jgi:DNA-binding GntR family transcriptional regulator